MLADKAAVKQGSAGLVWWTTPRLHYRPHTSRSSFPLRRWRREKSCFWGRRNASSQEIPWSNYRAREGKLFVPPFITLIDKSGGAVFSGGGGGGELRGLTKVGESRGPDFRGLLIPLGGPTVAQRLLSHRSWGGGWGGGGCRAEMAGEDGGVVGVILVQTLINCLFRGYRGPQ